ncbi:MAG: helix-turn-helix domain-containing protein [Gemmatirosa sp.]
MRTVDYVAGNAKRAGRHGAVLTVGELLRAWRVRRRHSQLSLALHADVSARHLSFLETGRARPSREMVQQLAEALEIPPRERDALLLAAGFAPEAAPSAPDDALLRGVRDAVDLLLAALMPSPALAVDRQWTVVAHNPALALLMADVDPSLATPPVNALRASLHPRGLAPRIVNLAQWRAHVLARLRRDVALTADAQLAALRDELRAYPPPPGAARDDGDAAPGVVVPLRVRSPHGTLAFLGTTTIFGTALDASAAELTIEAFLPADAHTAAVLREHAAR